METESPPLLPRNRGCLKGINALRGMETQGQLPLQNRAVAGLKGINALRGMETPSPGKAKNLQDNEFEGN